MATAAIQDWKNIPLVDRVVRVIDRVSGGLRASTSFTRPAQTPSPFGNFGVTAAMGVKPAFGKSFKEAAFFTLEEARDRISSFIENRFAPASLSELVKYLSDRFLRLETRSGPSGLLNYLVDTKSGSALPAAQVDPRLSHKAILSSNLRAALREQIGRQEPADAFHSWQGMRLVIENSTSGTGYTVSRGVGWYGKVYATASDDPKMNLEIVKRAKAEGIDLVLPTRADGPVASLVEGMPILVRSKSLKAADVHPGLDHGVLASAFGKGLIETYDGINQRKNAKVGGGTANVVSFDDFKAKFLRKNPEPDLSEASSNDSGSFGGLFDGPEKRDFAIRRDSGENKLYVFDRDIREEIAVSPNTLPAGRYDRENGKGVKEGYTEILEGGGIRHFNLEGKPVSLAPKPDRSLETDLPTYGRR